MFIASVTTSSLWGDLHLKGNRMRSILYHPPERDGKFQFQIPSLSISNGIFTRSSKNGILHFHVDSRITLERKTDIPPPVLITHVDTGKEYIASWKHCTWIQLYKHEMILIIFVCLYFPTLLLLSSKAK
jgi:hypothetical protein